MKKYDVVIIGGGPAGSIAAAQLNKTGCSVLILKIPIPQVCDW